VEARDAERVDEVVADHLSEEEAVDQARIEGAACEHLSEEGHVTVEEAEDFSILAEEEISALDELVRAEDELRSTRTEARGLAADQFLKPGGEWGGSEAPVRRAIRIATNNGLTVTSTKRTILSSGSDHHVSQKMAFAADLSNGSSPTPQMDKTAREIAGALGHPGWRGGVLTTSQGAARAQLLWRTTVGGNHFNHVHFGVRISGRVTPGMPMLTRPYLRGEEVRWIQRRLLELGFGPLDVDGVFGPDTDDAVRRFQGARGLKVDGIVGPRTRRALD
jgi:murein L,D-transpeptidase YcbB/YkuD